MVVVIDLVDGSVVQHVQLVQVGQLALVPRPPATRSHLDTPRQLGSVVQLLEALHPWPASLGHFLLLLHRAATWDSEVMLVECDLISNF